MKCEYCPYNLGEVCQASLKDSKLVGCYPFADKVLCMEQACSKYDECIKHMVVPAECPAECPAED